MLIAPCFSQSRTLPEAVMEYKNRYGMLPPKGFDAWWKFVIEKDIKIVDDVRVWYRTNVFDPLVHADQLILMAV
jgi:hypothetical protein